MAAVEEQLAALEQMPPAALHERWKKLTGEPVPRISPALLRLALAWEIQTRAYGGLSRITQQRLAQLTAAKTRTTPAQPGTRLVREWNGTAHIVVIGEDNVIRWNDREWRSLSQVARAITGTQWSGPAFFGLKRRAVA
ncbi:DUF2924 domain-containing protein [Sphingomonas sp. 7/4-4]|uniref:DUF2924 domain-containing protein n=1 Tax=Sphingomonas sp. 7/4-4 TaxID=3018446 RepID=UPI0022F3FA01|nr:DUF2924 domain-containing protein [Sphingomonas sp. 7/4-4]WBY08141.1 DUF2924 domain-containing protein [Sphingomonas sp. 7/4-4]